MTETILAGHDLQGGEILIIAPNLYSNRRGGPCHPGLFAQNPPPKPDNSAVNSQDRQQGAVTADQQKANPNDRALTQQIRISLVKDKSLSTYAHNVKVDSQNGVVTLKGPVCSEEERHSVEAKAAEIAGRDNVRSEISIAPKPAPSSK
jgi:hyperosmotically inducible periplasmic protein